MASRGLAIGFVLGAGVGAGGCYFYVKSIGPAQKADVLSDKQRHHALTYGVPATEFIKECTGYVAAFDLRTKNPKWVLEHITAETSNGDADRSKSDFFEDPALDPLLRSKLSDYKSSGFDRGHLAPAANHKQSQQAMDETFNLVNISPQVGDGFNRDYWARFEKYVKDLTRSNKDVYVVTGPLWLPRQDAEGRWAMQHQLIGEPPSLVSVPTHFYKVVLTAGRRDPNQKQQQQAQAGDGPLAVAAFVMPNQPIDPKTPLSAFVVPLEPLEAVAGTRFFPEAMSVRRKQVLDEAAVAWRTQGLSTVRLFDRQALIDSAPAISRALPAPGTTSASSSGSIPAPGVAVTATNAVAVVAEAPQPPSISMETPSSPAQVPRTRTGLGVVHLCEHAGCRLPPENFWEKGKGNGGAKGRGGGPSRSKSSSW